MANRGVAPLDDSTLVGQFRLLYGDTQYTALDPVESGYGDYTELSDAEIEMFLSRGDDSISRAIGYYYLRLAGDAAKRSGVFKDYDLSVDLKARAQDLRASANDWFARADEEDAISGDSDVFVIADAPGSTTYRWVEGLYV